MRKYKVRFTDTREDSETNGKIIASYEEIAEFPNEAIEHAFPKFFKDHQDFDPAQSGAVSAQATTTD